MHGTYFLQSPIMDLHRPIKHVVYYAFALTGATLLLVFVVVIVVTPRPRLRNATVGFHEVEDVLAALPPAAVPLGPFQRVEGNHQQDACKR